VNHKKEKKGRLKCEEFNYRRVLGLVTKYLSISFYEALPFMMFYAISFYPVKDRRNIQL